MEQERPNIFTQSVANIMPGDRVEISISYVDVLSYSSGAYELVFPMVVGPRYIPGNAAVGHQGTGWAPDTDQVPDASRITPPVLEPGMRSGHDIALAVEVDAGVPIQGIHSTSHAVDVWDLSRRAARVAIHPSDTIPNKDFVLRYEVAGEAPQVAIIPHHDERGGFFTLLVQPQREVGDDQVVPRELIFILDTSGSMRGLPLDRSKEAMRRLIEGMRPGDTFNVVRFAGDTGTLWSGPRPYSESNAEEAMSYVEQLRGAGGTEMRTGIVEALSQPAEPGMLRIAFLLTDGYVGNENQILRAIEETRRGARIFTLGVGSSVNRFLLDRAATVGRGEAFYVRQDEDSEEVIDRFFSRVDRPALAHVEIDWGSLDVGELYPSRVPDLWAGQPIQLHGRYRRGGEDTVVVTGQLGTRPYRQEVRVSLPRDHSANEAMASVWARRKVEQLMLEIATSGETEERVEEVTRLGLEFRLMTRWTSFVAVEEKVVNVDGKPQTVVQPVEMPEGVSYEGVFGGPVVAQDSAKLMAFAPAGGSRPRTGVSTRHENLVLGVPEAPPPRPRPTSVAVELEEKAAGTIVELESVSARGGLKHPQVLEVIKASLPDLRRAYRTRLAAVPGLSGTLQVTLKVQPDGAVHEVLFTGGSQTDEALREAVELVLSGLRFPPVAGRGRAEVRLVLRFGA